MAKTKITSILNKLTGNNLPGKTFSSSQIANGLGDDNYKIDLSMVISKYIGETEKNISRIFDRAKDKKWILLFDEADALFGKRTNVRDAHDRYANQEVSYLLNYLEKNKREALFRFRDGSILSVEVMKRFHAIFNA